MMISKAELTKKLQDAWVNGYHYGRYIIYMDLESGAVVVGDKYVHRKGISQVAIKYIPDKFKYPK